MAELDVPAAAIGLVELLRAERLQIVLAESCTGGLVAASLVAIPGVSDCLCGSAVTYQDDVKTSWLGVDSEAIRRESAVSDTVAWQMARGALELTAAADIAISVTGHLGPSAPEGFDGLVFIGFAERIGNEISTNVSKFVLNSWGRADRQREAVARTLLQAHEWVGKPDSSRTKRP